MKGFKKTNGFILLILALLISCAVEVFLLNFDFFASRLEGFEKQNLNLSDFSGSDSAGVPVLPESASYSFDNLNIATRSIRITTSGPVGIVSGNIGICDDANQYKTVASHSFSLNPGGTENSVTLRINSRGNLTRLRVTFDNPEAPFYITSVVLNPVSRMDFNFLRFFLMAFLLWLVSVSFRYRLYSQDYDSTCRSHNRMLLGTVAFCLAVALGILYEGSASHSYLQTYPTLDELRSYDTETACNPYIQQLDAFSKGQTALDLEVNPELYTLDNVYDTGERVKKNVSYYWDRAYYEGAYYSYFGLAPLYTVYYPIYILTGKLPTDLLANSAFALLAVLGIFSAIHAMLRYYKIKANLLLYLLGTIAVVFGSFIYMIQASCTFYYIPLLSAIAWLAVFIAVSYDACFQKTNSRKIILFALSGISFVLIVMSRPNVALLAIAFACPLFIRVLLQKEASIRQKLPAVIPFLIPVILGGLGIMYYNYIRFDSVTEFGTSYQLTESNITYNRLVLSFHHFRSMFYHYFIEGFVHREFFPFISFTTDKCYDFGNYLYQEYSAGLLQLPLNLFVLLSGFTIFNKQKKNPVQKWTYLSVLSGILILGYLNFMLGGIHIRYVCDLGLAVSLIALFSMLEHVHFSNVKSSHILYGITIACCLATIVIGGLLIFSNETNDIFANNPDFYLQAAHMFRCW